MKKLFFLLISIFGSLQYAQAQSTNWCLPGAQWYYQSNNFSRIGYTHVRYVSDTLIGSVSCKRLVEHYKVKDFFSPDTTNEYKNVFAFESNGVIYYYNQRYPSSSYTWDTLYNYNATAGEKWKIYQQDTIEVEVLNSGIKIYQGEALKWLAVNINTSYINTNPDTIYEHIGLSGYNYPFAISGRESDPNIYQLCNYSDNQIAQWGNAEGTCSTITGEANSVQSKLSLTAFPNPASENLIVKLSNWPETTVTIELQDILGRVIKSMKQTVTKSNIDVTLALTTLPKGIYILQAKQDNIMRSIKIVKQ